MNRGRFYLVVIMLLSVILMGGWLVNNNLVNRSKEKKQGQVAEMEDSKEPEIPEKDINKEEPQPVVESIKISAVGDCTLGGHVSYNYSGSFNEYYDKKGQNHFFERVKAIFSEDDFTIANLECALTNYSKYQDKTYVYGGRPEYAEILKAGSIEVMSLDNNHSYDYLKQGFLDTKEALTKAGVSYSYRDEIAIKEAKGIKVAFISISSWSSNEETVRKYLKAAEEQGAQLKIISVHWGSNYEEKQTREQESFGRMLIDCGADLVLGHHPHVLQGIEKYQGKYIVYSLGNFSYGGKRKLGGENDTMIFQQEFRFVDGVLKDEDINIIPAYMSSQAPLNNYQPMAVEDEAEQERILNKIYRVSKGLE